MPFLQLVSAFWTWLVGAEHPGLESSDMSNPVVLMYEGKVDNIWPEIIRLGNIRAALKGRLPDLKDECTRLTPLDHGASHVVIVMVETRMGKEYIVRVTGTDHDDFMFAQPFWQEYKELSEVSSMLALRKCTTIPVPHVYFADKDEHHRVGGFWTLQEYMPGENLWDLWPRLSHGARVQAIKQVADWMLELFHLEFDTIGSLHCTSDFEGVRNLSDSDLNFHVGSMVTLRGLPSGGILGPPRNPGPWRDARAWLKSTAQGDMEFQRRIKSTPVPEYIDKVKAIIDEPQELNGLFLSGPLSVNVPFALDMWNFRNIKAQLEGDTLTLTALLDMEGMQILPRWVLGQAPRIDDLEADMSDLLLELLLNDPVFKLAHEDGSHARHLFVLATRATMSKPMDEWIEEFRNRVWEDVATMGG
ncbi:hypothetical protein DACRYDRAFT_109195 [Dacryopinax primogenitus]|uniref:Aminoglycoside phosphotransferase domain-containing protein n=1 Tax=Dacryopinax primogenitus (strain DJM 731) TaxID=1858805 RepID=M5FSM4_DACPD|nr:uncharacterized protein DACRYDRAFT_109195 [Dacryopinax primogenitus]EJU00476.1 hypothetical protein DACRYDRAFT_109195 [Dacryopinax primogenitus]